MRLYHLTDRDSARSILERGFEDTEVLHDNRELCIGVWLADRCLAGEDDVGPRLGPTPDHVLVLALPDDVVEPYERRGAGHPYREFCVPADVVNGFDVERSQPIDEVDPNERRRIGEPLEES